MVERLRLIRLGPVPKAVEVEEDATVVGVSIKRRRTTKR
jgi:hypothetical protein